MSAHNTRPTVAPVATDAPQSGWGTWLVAIARGLNQALRGKINATTTVTLNASATSTILYDSRIGYFTHVQLSPSSASGAQSLVMGIWITCTPGQALINHVFYDAVDQTFSVLLIG